MPAYRSADEAEIRDAVVARLREARPDARIIHEIQCSVFGPNRIDVVAVSPDEIVSVEIKSKRDKIDRLPAQIASMKLMSHHVIAALHEKFCPERETNQWGAHYERDGKFYVRAEPPECANARMWLYPKPDKAGWLLYDRKPGQANFACLDMLWAEELRTFCAMNGLHHTRSSTREGMLSLIRWNCTGAQITKGVCSILRARTCIEADPAIDIKLERAA